MLEYCYFNGKITPVQEAHVAVNDLALLRGYAIFDYFRTFNGKPFLIDAYLDRFYTSAQRMSLIVPESKEQIKIILGNLLQKNGVKDAAFRFVLTGGNSMDSYSPGVPTFYIIVEKNVEYPPELYEKGVHIIMHEHLRMFPDIKTVNYVTGIRLDKEKLRQNAVEILYTYEGNVLECVRNNFFLVKKDRLVTAGKNILSGRTRNLTIELAKKQFAVEERDVSVEELKEATEAFITGSTKRIMPVVSIDDFFIGDGKVGTVTKSLMQSINDFIRSY